MAAVPEFLSPGFSTQVFSPLGPLAMGGAGGLLLCKFLFGGAFEPGSRLREAPPGEKKKHVMTRLTIFRNNPDFGHDLAP
jgi:hypothetical protein